MKAFASLASVALLATASIALSPAARAGDDAQINARIGAWGRNCKNALLVKYPKASMADISVQLGATLKQSIDAGETTLADIKKSGLSYNWTVKKQSGYCNTNGAGTVTDLVKQ